MHSTNKIFLKCTTIIFFVALFHIAKAQVSSFTVDNKDILIGEKITLAFITQNTIVVSIPDSIPHFEIKTKDTRDTLVNNLPFLKTEITFTSFDSGSFYFPAIQNKINSAANVTDSFLVNVGYMPIDKGAKPRDIKSIIEINYFNWTMLVWIGVGLLSLMLLLFVVRKIFKKENAKIITLNKNAYKEAVLALQNLNNLNAENKISIKELHTTLATILKTYYSNIDNSNMLAKTSSEVLQKLDVYKLQAEIATQAKTALETGDATKFANYIPQLQENKNAINFIQNTIDGIENIQQQKTKN